MLTDILITILTCLVYLLANGFTYDMFTHRPCGRPLRDVMHEFLPDLSNWVYARDIVLLLLFAPVVMIRDKLEFASHMWSAFRIVVLIKAISIFFTFIPPSNPHCEEKRYLNHCFHSSTSGHAAIVVILAMLYIKHGLFQDKKDIVMLVTLLYCILILMTRAHYTVDVIQGVVVSGLIMLGGCRCTC